MKIFSHEWVDCSYRSIIKSNQIKSNQIKSNQIKSNQIKSNQIKSKIKSNQIKANQINLIKSNQIKLNQTKPKEIKPNQTKPNQTKPNQTKPNQIKSNPIIIINIMVSYSNKNSLKKGSISNLKSLDVGSLKSNFSFILFPTFAIFFSNVSIWKIRFGISLQI